MHSHWNRSKIINLMHYCDFEVRGVCCVFLFIQKKVHHQLYDEGINLKAIYKFDLFNKN